MERPEFEQWKPKEVVRLLALVETERRYYQEIVSTLPVSLLIVGPDLHAVSANRQFRLRTGKKNDDILGKPLAAILNVEGLDELAKQVVSTSLPAPRQDLHWAGQPISVTVLPLRNWQEDPESEALIVIEDQSSAAPPLTPAQAKAISIADSFDGMLWELDYAAGGLTHASAGAEILFGYPVERWLKDPEIWALRVAASERKRVDEFYDHLTTSSGQLFSIEFLARHAQGRDFYVRETVRVERDATGKPLRLAGLTTNVAERRELESQHSLAIKSEALQRISAKLAHDLNNLLMIVAGYGEELKSAFPADNPLHQDMKEILGATERLYSLTTEFQSYTRRPVVQPTITSIAALVAQAAPRIEKTLSPNLTLEIAINPSIAKAKIDGAQIEEAIVALARHVARSMSDRGILRITGENVWRSEASDFENSLSTGPYVRLSIEHSGTIANTQVLEPWLQSGTAEREIELGVSAAYQILKQSKGELTSQANCFYLYLPVVSEAELEVERARAAAQLAIAPVVAETPAEPETTLETILVVEDEGGIRALVRKILRRQGYQVLEASHGDEALRVLTESGQKIDLLLTDVMMPGMNGVELSQRALAQDNTLKVLFVSGYTDESVLEAGQFPPGTSFLQKPFTLGSLLGKVREVLDNSAARQAASQR